MEISFGILFYQKKPKYYVTGPVPIYMRITVDGVERELSTKLSGDPDKWSSKANRLTGRTDDVKAVNDYLDLLQTKAIQARSRLVILQKAVTADHVKAIVQDKPVEAAHMIMDVFREHNKKIKELIPSGEYTDSTHERYETSYKHTLSFLNDKYKMSDIDIQKLDYTFISNYEHWLKTVRNCDHNTTMKYLSNFKKIVLICVKKKWLTQDPFGEFKMTKRKKKRKALSQIDLNNLITKNFASERLSVIRDIFLFSCYTGLAYSDVKKLRKKDVFIGIDGHRWITCVRKKVEKEDGSSNIPLLPAAERIMQAYQHDEVCVAKGVVLPVKSNQKMNEYLKEIADLCDIRIPLTFHIARHTFATTVTLSNKVPIETVSRMLAHQKIATTQEYARVLDNKVSDDMKELRKKFVI